MSKTHFHAVEGFPGGKDPPTLHPSPDSQSAAPLQRYEALFAAAAEDARRLPLGPGAWLTFEQAGCELPAAAYANQAHFGAVTILSYRFASSVSVKTTAEANFCSAIFPSAGSCELLHQERCIPLFPGDSAALLCPRPAPYPNLRGTFSGLLVAIPRALVDSALTSANSSLLSLPPIIDTSHGAGATLLALLGQVVADLDHAEPTLGSPLLRAKLVDALLFLLVAAQTKDSLSLKPALPRAREPSFLHKIEDYILRNAAEPLSVTDLADAAGVSIRSIQSAFRTHRNRSPMQIVRERRLELARNQLLAAGGATISQIALDCGFEHIGRFGQLYRHRFGEKPSDTLRRASTFASTASRPHRLTTTESRKRGM